MAIHYNPTTVSDGLVLALDAANTRSYGGSGTTWTDVSYRGNNGTLNGPAYTTVGFNEPFGGAGGVYFDGSGSNGSLTNTDYLTIPQSSSWLYTGDYTIEFWLYQTTNTDWCAYDTGGSGSADQFVAISGTVFWGYGTASAVTGTFGSGDVNTWVHWAVSRSGTTTRMFKNGVVVSSYTGAVSNIGRNNAALFVGVRRDGYYRINGYLSNLRVVNGTALYTEDFTPPRSLLTAISGTSLLTCQKGSITDASSNNFAITVNGDARPVYGFPSFKFDGSNDYATIPVNSYFEFGTNEFTVESWVNLAANTNVSSRIMGIGEGANGSPAYYTGWLFSIRNTNKLGFYRYDGTEYNYEATIPAFSTNQWFHYVATRDSSNTLRLFSNGSLIQAFTSVNLAFNAVNSDPFYIGRQVDGSGGLSYKYLNGKISNLRIYKGKALTAEEVEQNYNALKGRFGL